MPPPRVASTGPKARRETRVSPPEAARPIGARPKRLLPLTLACLAALAILVGLGTWQLRRLAWKEGLLAKVESRVNAPAQAVPPVEAWPFLAADQVEYRHVVARGVFNHAKETLVYTVEEGMGPLSGPGYFVITPLMRENGPAILVNRGFVPQDRRDPSTREEGQMEGVVTITGLLRMPEEASSFVPANDPAHDAWYRRDPAEIGKARGLPDAAPFIIDADATPNPGGLPVGGRTRTAFPNRHLEYALTWYGLAAALVGVYAAVVISRRRAARGR